MRITDKMHNAMVIAWQQRASERLAKQGRMAATGERVSAPSDSPSEFASRIRYDAQLASMDARSSALDRTSSSLELAETTLAASAEILVQAREIALSMANGSVDAHTRVATAAQIEGLRSALMGLANTKSPDGYIFGGTRSDAPPFDATGAFQGNDGVVRVEVAEGVTTAANTSGARAFTAAGGQDVFGTLTNLITALSNNDIHALTDVGRQLVDAHRQIIDARVTAGLSFERVRSAIDVTANATTAVKTARAAVVEGDASATVSGLVEAQQAFERSVSVGRELLSTLGRTTQ